jgi:hypothetical protein
MIDRKNNLGNFFEEMLKKGLVTTGNTWIEKAIEQKNARMLVSIASSRLLVYDALDLKLLMLGKNN